MTAQLVADKLVKFLCKKTTIIIVKIVNCGDVLSSKRRNKRRRRYRQENDKTTTGVETQILVLL